MPFDLWWNINYVITLINEPYSSFSLITQESLSLGPAFVFKRGIEARLFFVASSTILVLMSPDQAAVTTIRAGGGVNESRGGELLENQLGGIKYRVVKIASFP